MAWTSDRTNAWWWERSALSILRSEFNVVSISVLWASSEAFCRYSSAVRLVMEMECARTISLRVPTSERMAVIWAWDSALGIAGLGVWLKGRLWKVCGGLGGGCSFRRLSRLLII